ncbi:hypothetical protein [Neptunicella sp. SCSIO 80796]|uniref:hypothetical protein n=1 Tax=Neptunicella plasticusilytica TaxID=3117012 RepID=UPI003A4DB43B
MQPNKTKLALQVGALLLGASCGFSTSADTFNITVNTISDVEIDTVTALDFGEYIITDANTSCAMDASTPEDAVVFADGGLTATDYGLLNGDGCVGDGVSVGTPGVYSITGVAGLDIKITLNSEAQAGGDFTYTPDGCVVDHDGASGGDLCTALAAGNQVTATIADGVDDGDAISGETHFTVGGVIDIGATGLTSDTDYDATFLVNVVY